MLKLDGSVCNLFDKADPYGARLVGGLPVQADPSRAESERRMTTQMIPATYAYCPLCGNGEFRFVFHDKSAGFDFLILECRKCGLLVSNPRLKQRIFNTITEIDSHQSHQIDVCARNLGKYERFFKLLPAGGRHPRVLDVGCCRGEFVGLAVKHGYDAYGVDMVPVFVEYAKSSFGKRFAVVDSDLGAALEKLGVTTFDIITLWDVIEHIDEPIEFCRNLAQLLRPGGSIFLRTPNKHGQMIKRGVLHPFFGDRITYINPIEHIQIFGPSNVRMLADICGLKMAHCEPSVVEAYGDRGKLFDFIKRYVYWPAVQSSFRATGWNLGHSLNCVFTMKS
jgi:SAM-dependent methyltransferase